jgi:hypothetical protein
MLTAGTPQINETGTAATLPITVSQSAQGKFVLVATNSIGSSDSLPSSGNTLTLINAQDEQDADGDGFPDGVELLFGSDPLDAASVSNLSSRGELLAAVSVVNTFLTLETPQTLVSAAFSVSNTRLTSETPQTLVSGAFSVANTLVTTEIPHGVVSAAFSVANTLAAPATAQELLGPAFSVLNSRPVTTTAGQPIPNR